MKRPDVRVTSYFGSWSGEWVIGQKRSVTTVRRQRAQSLAEESRVDTPEEYTRDVTDSVRRRYPGLELTEADRVLVTTRPRQSLVSEISVLQEVPR